MTANSTILTTIVDVLMVVVVVVVLVSSSEYTKSKKLARINLFLLVIFSAHIPFLSTLQKWSREKWRDMSTINSFLTTSLSCFPYFLCGSSLMFFSMV
uniref:Uncharacterized protein n=1 Tax=Anopheles darlingi TaxID=43151 RepID=A0A2M4DIW3_ANODA